MESKWRPKNVDDRCCTLAFCQAKNKTNFSKKCSVIVIICHFNTIEGCTGGADGTVAGRLVVWSTVSDLELAMWVNVNHLLRTAALILSPFIFAIYKVVIHIPICICFLNPHEQFFPRLWLTSALAKTNLAPTHSTTAWLINFCIFVSFHCLQLQWVCVPNNTDLNVWWHLINSCEAFCCSLFRFRWMVHTWH